MRLLAQKLIFPSGEVDGPVPQFKNLADIVNKLLPVLFTLAGLILFIMFIWGGFDLLTSGGDPKKAESAKGKITNAIIGFAIVFIAYWLTQILSFVFGLEVF